MKKLGFMLFLVLMLGIVSGSALAQSAPTGDGSTYFVTYYANANPSSGYSQNSGAPDAVVRFINDGDTNGTLWASYYVFDDSQELQECCSCGITADGLNSEDLNYDLLGNVLTAKATTKGVIKVISFDLRPDRPETRGWTARLCHPHPTRQSGLQHEWQRQRLFLRYGSSVCGRESRG